MFVSFFSSISIEGTRPAKAWLFLNWLALYEVQSAVQSCVLCSDNVYFTFFMLFLDYLYFDNNL